MECCDSEAKESMIMGLAFRSVVNVTCEKDKCIQNYNFPHDSRHGKNPFAMHFILFSAVHSIFQKRTSKYRTGPAQTIYMVRLSLYDIIFAFLIVIWEKMEGNMSSKTFTSPMNPHML